MIAVGATVALVAGVYAWMEYDRGVADAGAMAVKEKVTAPDLLAAFQADEASATARYVGATEQAIQVTGIVRAIEPQPGGPVNVVLETGDDLAGVVCEFAQGTVPAAWTTGGEVAVKGICTGALMDVVLVRCVPAG